MPLPVTLFAQFRRTRQPRRSDIMRHHTITGGGGTRLHVLENGNPRGRPILFIHGLSQCSLAWARQLNSDLAHRFRLVAMDMRGHGSSDRPTAGYDDSRLWADDVAAVIRELELEQPILSGWSYGPFLILDYIRHHGESAIGGVQFVAGITKLGSDAAVAVLTPEILQLVSGLFSHDADESVRTLQAFIALFFARELLTPDRFMMLGYNASVPPAIRQALFSRLVDNDELMRTITKPVLLTHGAEDAVVKGVVVEQHRALLANAQVDIMPAAGHAPFWDDPAAFNRRLAAFCDAIADHPALAGR
jgi:pimeloyl-ACP methyl ester carboxylesterase